MAEHKSRPKHVVIVDAMNPLEEIHGEFFWLEDHEQILASERSTAYRDGYEAGLRAAHGDPVQVVLKVRRSLASRLLRWVFLALVTMALLAGILLLVGAAVGG